MTQKIQNHINDYLHLQIAQKSEKKEIEGKLEKA